MELCIALIKHFNTLCDTHVILLSWRHLNDAIRPFHIYIFFVVVEKQNAVTELLSFLLIFGVCFCRIFFFFTTFHTENFAFIPVADIRSAWTYFSNSNIHFFFFFFTVIMTRTFGVWTTKAKRHEINFKVVRFVKGGWEEWKIKCHLKHLFLL